MINSLLGSGVEINLDNDPFDYLSTLSAAQIKDELKRINALYTRLKYNRSQWEPDWEDVADHINPHGYKRKDKTPNKGYNSQAKIMNESVQLASSRSAAGMQGGMTNKARPWFSLTTTDEDLAEQKHIKHWLQKTTETMRGVLIRSNFYKEAARLYRQEIDFGTAAMVAMDDDDDIIRFSTQTMGSYYISEGKRGLVEVFVLEMDMTVRQLVARFGLNRVSESVKNKWNKGHKEENVPVLWTVEPNEDYKVGSENPVNMRYRSTYCEKGKEQGLLSLKGFHLFPVMAPRWEKNNQDPWGVGPGIIAVGGQKALTLLEKQRSMAHELSIQPPMRASTNMAARPKSSLPASITYTDQNDTWEPAFQPSLDEAGTAQEVREIEDRARRVYFEDLFLMISGIDDSTMTATEVQARLQERMVVLGPVVETNEDEFLDPLIDILYDTCWRRGLIDDPPEELIDQKLKLEHTSVLAQAQKAGGITLLDRYIGSLANIASVTGDPSVFDNLNEDKAAERYGTLIGIDAEVQNSPQEVAQIRAERQKQIQQQQQMEVAMQTAQAAKTLSDTSMEGNNALTQAITGGAV